MKRTFILLLSTFSLLISGCNLDLLETEISDKSGEIIKIHQVPIPIDSETHYEVYEGEISDNNPPVQRYIEITNYSFNDYISNHTGYQISGDGPFFTITNSRFIDDQLTRSSTSYINNSGELEFLIDDTTYANKNDVTFSSERDATLSTYQIGEAYITKGSQRRYDNNSHNLQLILQSETVFTPKKLEKLSISSGIFDTLKIDFVQNSEINNIYRADVILKSFGSQWLDITTGRIVKESVRTTLYDARSFGTDYEQSIKYISERTYLFDRALAGKVIEPQKAKFLNSQGSKGKYWHKPALL